MLDDLGDRMKGLEAVEAKRRLDTSLPVIARLDGRGFSKFTKGFDKPFDTCLTNSMDSATKYLVEATGADVGYTQSDEITLIWGPKENPLSQMFFDGRTQKLCSVLASSCSMMFAVELSQKMGNINAVFARLPHFDCRVWTVPSKAEAANTLLWRSQDARRNGITVFCQQWVSHNKLQGLCQKDMLKAAHDAGAPPLSEYCSKREQFGGYYKRITTRAALSADIINNMPEKDRPEPGITFVRSKVKCAAECYFGDIGNAKERERFIFDKFDVTDCIRTLACE
jgi:tRNA(His) 5'-end guanylyltransferase